METRQLDIVLHDAKDLNKVNFITKMDVYAVVSVSGGDKTSSKQKTKTFVDHDGDSNPSWNFPISFVLDEASLQHNRLTLHFKLVCERALGDKDVGDVHVPIKELLDSPAKPGADGKRFVSYQVRKPSGKPKGQVTFSYKFGEKTPSAASAAVAPPYAPAIPAPPPSGKADSEPVTAYPAGPSSVYPPPGPYPPPAGYPGAAEGGGGHYPSPASGYPSAGAPTHGSYPPPPPQGYGYPPPPPPPHGYGYPPPPPPGYGYPAAGGYGYPAAPVVVQQPPKKNNKFGMGLGAGLLGGALGGLLIGDAIADAGDYDCGGGFDF